MFEFLKNLGNMGELMRRAGEMREQMQKVQEELARQEITGDAGGGMVTATVNGRMELVRLRIDKSQIDASDTELLEDLVVAAVRAAQTKAGEVMREEMQKAAGGLNLPPGFPGLGG